MGIVQPGGSGGGGGGGAGKEISYTQITSNVTILSTSESAGTTILSPAAAAFDGSPVICQFFSPVVGVDTGAAGDALIISLFESTTQIARLAACTTLSTTTRLSLALCGFLRFTPTAGSHTYTVTAFCTSATGSPFIGAGATGTGAYSPAFVRFTKV